MGWPANLNFYNLLRDWGSVIGGGFALIAGILAYRSGRVQANAVERQNAYLKRADRDRLARERLQTARMLDASMEVIAADIARVRGFFGGPPDGHIDESLAKSIREGIGKPGFSSLWEKIGVLDREIAVRFLTLEAEIDRFQAVSGATFVSGITDRLDERAAMVANLRQLADREVDSANAVLLERDPTA